MGHRSYCVYIASNRHRTVLYIGVTNDLARRVTEHKSGVGSAFTVSYNVGDLLYFEEYGEIRQAISREKQLKARSRNKKLDLIRKMNPNLADLADGL